MIPPHRIAIGEGWSLWRTVALRGAGFPARDVLELASVELAAAATRVDDLDAQIAARRTELAADLKAYAATLPPDARGDAQAALKRLYAHKVPAPLAPHAPPALEARRAELAALTAQRDDGALAATYERATLTTGRGLRRLAARDRFRKAVLWQNHRAVTTGIDGLLRQPEGATDSRTRSNERLVASYVQRYAVKNDTIGFFGPIGWAQLGGPSGGVAQAPGRDLLATRHVYYEYWGIDALARQLSSIPELRPHLAPRLLPRFRIDGDTLVLPQGKRSKLPSEFAAVASRCDGRTSARQLARALGMDEAEVFEVLDELLANHLVVWELEIPTGTHFPERVLVERLESIPDPEVRDRALGMFAELERARAAVSSSRDAAQLSAALAGFAATFAAVTGSESTRSHGQTYAGRTPIYEDCRRDLGVTIGDALVHRVGASLGLVLHSARWLTYEYASRARAALDAQFAARGEVRVDFYAMLDGLSAIFAGTTAESLCVQTVSELQQKWAAILGLPPAGSADRSPIRLRAVDIADAVRAAFPAPGPGWPSARHQSPDLMIAARGADAAARGDVTFVLGELHVGMNTLFQPRFAKEHPDPGSLIAWRDADIGGGQIAPVWAKTINLADYYSLSPADYHMVHGDTTSARSPDHQVPISAFVVERGASGRLQVATRDGALRWDMIAFLEQNLLADALSSFTLLPAREFTPRIQIDELVIRRATWRIDPKSLGWPQLDTPFARFDGARKWARELGLPRWVFVKTPEETKPVYVDFASPLFVEMLAKQLRGASAASFSEMLPTMEEAWVTDAAGELYTSELRICAVDPVPWNPAA